MPKHKPLETTLRDCIERIDDRNPDPWYDVMGIEIPGLAAALSDVDAAEAIANYDEAELLLAKADAIEAAYIRQHANDPITVVWPEHVLTPRFNSDATYT